MWMILWFYDFLIGIQLPFFFPCPACYWFRFALPLPCDALRWFALCRCLTLAKNPNRGRKRIKKKRIPNWLEERVSEEEERRREIWQPERNLEKIDVGPLGTGWGCWRDVTCPERAKVGWRKERRRRRRKKREKRKIEEAHLTYECVR